MAAPRASSFKALRSVQKVTTRGIRVTAVQSSPKSADPTHKTTYMPWGLQDLRNECKKRSMTITGTKSELIDRLAGHDSLQARAFSIAMRRIAKEQTTKPVSGPANTTPSRHFNTSRANKANNDSSTIDFAYLPKLFEGEFIPQPAAIRVPILPHILSDDAESVFEKHAHLDAAAGGYQDTEAGDRQMKAQISTVHGSSGDVISHMSDVGDGHTEEMSVDTLATLSTVLANNVDSLAEKVKGNEQGAVRQVWSGFLDDLFGSSQKRA